MRHSRRTRPVKPCDICGHIGFAEQIATCYQCKSAREHVYCMKVLLFTMPEVWFCEECRSSKCQVFPKSVKRELFPGAVTSTEIFGEGIKLKLGAPKVKLFSKSDLRKNHGCQTGTLVMESKRTPRFESELSKFSLQEVNVNPGVKAGTDCKPLGRGNGEILSITQWQVPQTSNKMKVEKTNKQRHACKEEPQDSLETLNMRVEKAAKFTHLPSEDSLPIISCDDAQQYNLQSMPKDGLRNLRCLTSYAIWCGSIEMLNLETCSKFYDGFWAYLPGKVHRKALEFSKQMPGVLLCSPVARCNICLKVFHNDSPNIDDVALIFFPGNFQRSKEQYDSLLGLIEMQDLVLKSFINGVELLIFSSKSLQSNSSGFKLGSFLWGVYHNVEVNQEVPSLLTHGAIFQVHTESSSVRSKIKQSLTEAKIEPYNIDTDAPPGFPSQAAANADSGRQ